MAQIAKKFIANNAVDGTKIELLNAQAFNALNSSASQTEIFNFSSANNFQFNVQVDANSNAIINLPAPVNPGDAVNKSYADGLVSNLSWKDVVVSATTTSLPTYTASGGVLTASANGALSAQDGVTLTVNQRLLVKNETGGNAPNNGIYVLTQVGTGLLPFILTRSSDANTAVELQSSAVCVGEAASTQAGQVFFENLAIATINVSNVGFIQINAGMSYTFGNGLHLSGSTVTVQAADTSINVASGGVSVALNTNGGLSTSSGVEVLSANSAIAVSSSGVGVALSSASGLLISSGLEVQASDSSITVASGGISVNLNSSGALATSSGLEVKVDSSTVEINGSNQLHGLACQVDNLTLNSTDITNQYKDLTYAITGTSSVWLSVIGGPIQQNGTDYTVSATGGVGGVGRISFAGGLATAGASALVSGDVLVIGYEHF